MISKNGKKTYVNVWLVCNSEQTISIRPLSLNETRYNYSRYLAFSRICLVISHTIIIGDNNLRKWAMNTNGRVRISPFSWTCDISGLLICSGLLLKTIFRLIWSECVLLSIIPFSFSDLSLTLNWSLPYSSWTHWHCTWSEIRLLKIPEESLWKYVFISQHREKCKRKI